MCSMVLAVHNWHMWTYFYAYREVDQEQTDMDIYTSKEGKCCVLYV